MKTFRPFCLVTFTAALALSGSAWAQTGTPVTEPPPATPERSQPATSQPRTGDEVNLTAATHSTGKSSGNNTLRDLRFAAVDANADGAISMSEFTTFVEAGNVTRSADSEPTGGSLAETLFRQIDTNRDNSISETELTSYQDQQDKTGPQR